MSTIEQIWFVVGIAGFLFVMEDAFNATANFIVKKIFRARIDEDTLKMGLGLFLFILALVMLFNLPND